MKWDKVNGCGACNGILRNIPIPHANFFKEDCLKHDIAYNIGGTKVDRKQADINLYKGMVERSVNYFDNRVGSQFWFICWAFFYYKAVRAFASRQFNYKQ